MKNSKDILMKFISTQGYKLAGEDNVFVDKSSIEGQGLFANKGFKKGEIIGLAHQQGQPVGLTGNFHNHSSSPNAVSVKKGSNRFLVAAKNLPAGAEITSDYRMQPELEQPSANWMQRGGLTFQPYYTPAAESTGANYTPTMTMQAAEKLKAQRDAQELARRRQAIQASQAAASKPLRKRLTPENLAQETGATGDKLRFFPNDPDSFIDDYLNPLKMVGDMASGLGRIPLNVKQGNYGAAALDVAIPVATGALAGLGAKSAGQFVNNLTNPLAGTGQFLTTKTPLKNAYRLNSVAAKQPTEVILSRVQRPGQTADLSRLDELLQRPPESLTLAERIELARINQPGYGRGFSSNPNDISYYSSPGIQSSRGYVGMPEIRSIRLPAEKAAKFNIRQNPVEGYFSGAPGREYLLPRNYVELSKKLTPQTFEELEQIRRLTDAETTALNTPHWWRGYPRINTPKQLFTSHSADFSKYLTQKEAVAARAERLLSQKHKKGWNEQLTPELEEKLSTAVQRHNPAGDYPGTSLGTNRSGRTETLVSKDANIKGVPLTDAQKSMIAAHETGHYYSNSLKEGMDWEKYFNFSDLPYRTSKYLKGKRHNFGNEIRERAAQLKDFIAYKNKIPLNQDFKITRTQLDDALENYVKETGLDNTMTPFIEALKKKGNISGFLKEMNKRPLVLLPPTIGAGTYGVNQKQDGGQHGGLDRWFAEKWVDIKTGKECGRQEGEKRAGYPACRPSKRISEDTPKTASELSSSEKQKFKRSKTSSERISYQHKRKQDGGEWLDKYENTKENRQKVDQLFGLPAAGNVNYVPVVESLVGGFSAGLAKNALAPVVKSSLRSLQKYMEMQENPFVKIDLPVFNEAKNWLNKYDD